MIVCMYGCILNVCTSVCVSLGGVQVSNFIGL